VTRSNLPVLSLICALAFAMSATAQDSASSPAFTVLDANPITFLSPLLEGDEGVKGKAIAELITGTPTFPPIEGLPDEVWKDQSCANCHQWNRERLCEQATFYTTPEGAANVTKKHPYGGSFKANLKVWAETGCQ
jgi:hypothetical protein